MGNPIFMADRPLGRFLPNPKLRLKGQFHEVCRFRHVAGWSKEAYLQWSKRFLLYCRDPPCLPMNRSAGLRPGAFQPAGYLGHREGSKTRYLVSYGPALVCAAHCMVEPRQVHPRPSVAKSVSPPIILPK